MKKIELTTKEISDMINKAVDKGKEHTTPSKETLASINSIKDELNSQAKSDSIMQKDIDYIKETVRELKKCFKEYSEKRDSVCLSNRTDIKKRVKTLEEFSNKAQGVVWLFGFIGFSNIVLIVVAVIFYFLNK